MHVTIEITPPKNLINLLEKYRDEITEEFLNDWADAVLFEAKRLLREGRIRGSKDPFGGGAFDRGNLAKYSFVMKNKEKEREVRFTEPQAVWIEYGTAPHMPPVRPLQLWARRNKMVNWKNAGWAIAKTIAKYGTPPKPFLRQATMSIQPRLQDIFNETLKRLD